MSVTDPPQSTKNILTTTQWLSVISIIVSLAGVYYKREKVKSVFTKKLPLQLLHLLMTCHELPHHRLLISCRRLQKEKWELERWIEHFILFL